MNAKEASPLEKKLRLMALLQSGETISGARLAAKLKVTRQALHKQILLLRSKGYKIEGKPKLGYRLTDKPDLLTPEEILPGLRTRALGRKLFCFERLDSTQNKAKELAERGEPEGTLVVAERQTAGRGRFGRLWVSNAGGIWATLILRPGIAPQNVPLISLALSLGIAKALEDVCGVRCGLKWPNDVLAQAGEAGPAAKFKKVCGILTEMSAEAERVKWVILGFGIDANNAIPAGLRPHAASLAELAGARAPLARLLGRVLERMEESYEIFLKEGFNPVRLEYLRRCILTGKRVALSDQNLRVEGKCLGLGADGTLLLLTDDGRMEKFYAGDVTLRAAASAARS